MSLTGTLKDLLLFLSTHFEDCVAPLRFCMLPKVT